MLGWALNLLLLLAVANTVKGTVERAMAKKPRAAPAYGTEARTCTRNLHQPPRR
jgi:hypothetical protein